MTTLITAAKETTFTPSPVFLFLGNNFDPQEFMFKLKFSYTFFNIILFLCFRGFGISSTLWSIF